MQSQDILPRSFYLDEPQNVAPLLLGKYLMRRLSNETLIGKIVETEAYPPYIDSAAHSYKGKTARTEVLWGEAGFSYVYSIHKHHCFDVVTLDIGTPGAVLVRALEPVKGINLMMKFRDTDVLQNLTNGPGKLCQAMSITRELNGVDVTSTDSPLIITKGETLDSKEIVTSKRIGVTSAKDLELRFFIKENKFVSK